MKILRNDPDPFNVRTSPIANVNYRISKYHNSVGKVNRNMSRAVMLEEERHKPELVSIGEKYLLCSNERFNKMLVKYLIYKEKMYLKKLNSENNR